MEETRIYELRKLESKDIFPMFKIISKIGIDEFKKCFSSDEIKDLIGSKGELEFDKLASIVGVSVGFDIASIIVTNIPKCENEIYDFLASVSNLKRKELEKLPMNVFLEMIIDLVKKEEFKDFFGVVSKLFK